MDESSFDPSMLGPREEITRDLLAELAAAADEDGQVSETAYMAAVVNAFRAVDGAIAALVDATRFGPGNV